MSDLDFSLEKVYCTSMTEIPTEMVHLETNESAELLPTRYTFAQRLKKTEEIAGRFAIVAAPTAILLYGLQCSKPIYAFVGGIMAFFAAMHVAGGRNEDPI
jgi:hypothetical protein